MTRLKTFEFDACRSTNDNRMTGYVEYLHRDTIEYLANHRDDQLDYSPITEFLELENTSVRDGRAPRSNPNPTILKHNRDDPALYNNFRDTLHCSRSKRLVLTPAV